MESLQFAWTMSDLWKNSNLGTMGYYKAMRVMVEFAKVGGSPIFALVVELADTSDLGSDSFRVQVQVLSRAFHLNTNYSRFPDLELKVF